MVRLVQMVRLWIGIDDTDSKDGMCTTYVGALVVDRLRKLGAKIIDFPRLIRLNPNWKLKTRGNCAVALNVEVQEQKVLGIKNMVLKTVEELAELDHDTTNPGVVFYQSEKIPVKLKAFSKKVIQDTVTIEEADALARDIGAEVHKFKLGRGIIGGLAAIGNTLEKDWTFELIAYRVPEKWGSKRMIDAASVVEMNSKTFPETFDNLDKSTGEIRITPHTPCPILYGIRGESAEVTVKAQKFVKEMEPIERIVIYKTNQGTDEHLRRARISEAMPNWSVIVDGEVCEKPRVILGGHVIFKICDGTGKIDCAAYEPTRQFREVVKKLVVGDKVRACGGMKEKPELPLTINLEKIAILKLAPALKKVNPICKICGRRMKSEGKDKGYSCKKCKIRLPPKAAKILKMPRDVTVGAFEVPPRARRHLAKPLIRVKQLRREY